MIENVLTAISIFYSTQYTMLFFEYDKKYHIIKKTLTAAAIAMADGDFLDGVRVVQLYSPPFVVDCTC